MSATIAAGILLGVGAGLGVLVLLAGITIPFRPHHRAQRAAQRRARPERRWDIARTRRLVGCLAAAVVTGAVTRWPVAALLAAAAGWALPAVIGPDREQARAVARIDAVATWTESLRDTLSAAAGLEQAIAATAPVSPAAIRPAVQRLSDALRAEARLPDALRAFAIEIDDATADLVVQALLMAAQRHARHLTDLLTALADAARADAALRMRVAASRARIRTATRVVTTVTLAMAAGLIVLNRDYLAPYDSSTGQLVLAVVGALFAAGFGWLAALSRTREPDRVLAPTHTTAEGRG